MLEQPIVCLECERLDAERQCLQRVYDLAVLNLSAVATSDERSIALKKLADDAKIDLERVDEEIAKHRDSHTGADGEAVVAP